MKTEWRGGRWPGMEVAILACALVPCSRAFAQTPIGSVSTLDADVSGASSIADDRAQLSGNGTVTARDHVAYVQLVRGGSVSVCATSGVHLTAGVPVAEASDTPAPASTPPAESTVPPLMLALDRGALELHTSAISTDIVMTPDLRIALSEAGPLDLRIRVTRNGDTCIENRVTGLTLHPTLHVGSLFGAETYDVLPGQHVLFEGGSLHEVVDNESSPCGCPAPAPQPIGEISLLGGDKTPSKQAEALHPFPAAVSQGLAPAPAVPQATPGVVHTQVATTLVFPEKESEKADDVPAKAAAPTSPPAATNPQQKSGFRHGIAHFFKRIFG